MDLAYGKNHRGSAYGRTYRPFTTAFVSSSLLDVTESSEKAGKGGEASSSALLEELKDAAVRLGFEVREEKLLREVGYHVRSGGCRLRGADLILLDRALPVAAQIDVLIDQLSGRSLDDVYLSPAARHLLERAARVAAARLEASTPSSEATA
ncbi:MAG: hypothetical protein HY270_08155 [Deltaproteobacteria bacterium]|nr:hypothetical protein [Deltaproteobacteria bacterium]